MDPVSGIAAASTTIKAAASILKQAAELADKAKNIELKEQLMSLREALMEIREENNSLRELNQELLSKVEDKNELSFNGFAYVIEGKESFYCPRCYEVDKKKVHLLVQGSQTRHLNCPECQATIDTQPGRPYASRAFKPNHIQD
jgi:translation initiation factor 2B subunit (eIF-2B alpha/beta/delta family)